MFNFQKIKKTFLIAEAGVNHEGDIKEAMKLVDIAKKSGADAVKFQTYLTDYYVASSEKERFKRVKKFELTFSDFKKISNYCKKKKIIFVSTPLDNQSVDFLYDFVPFFKISSGDITNHDLLVKIASKNKPILLSTGGANLKEIRKAINLIETNTKIDSSKYLALMHCVPLYPVPSKEANLRNILTLRKHFKNIIGYSDHTKGYEAAIVAVTLGANIIEKHFTVTREGKVFHDHFVSLDKNELPHFRDIIESARIMAGKQERVISKEVKSKLNHIRRSYAVNRNLKKGTVLSKEDLILVRPSNGYKENEISKVLNKKIKINMNKGSIINKKVLK